MIVAELSAHRSARQMQRPLSSMLLLFPELGSAVPQPGSVPLQAERPWVWEKGMGFAPSLVSESVTEFEFEFSLWPEHWR